MHLQEQNRIDENYKKDKDWLHWGPYLSERQWGTVREDYSVDGSAWDYFPHDHARSRTYRWGEDGMAGISDKYCNVCFGVTLWNGKDPILKERLFGLTGPEGNHGEDVKELYYYLENTPTHSYMKHLYKYSQNEFPYDRLVSENKKRGKDDLEFELLDTGIFEKNEYFDVFTEYAKADSEDILIKITIENRHEFAADIHVLPTLWIRNYWSFREQENKPVIKRETKNGNDYVSVSHEYVGDYNFYFDQADRLLFTENETNSERIYGTPNSQPFKKDFFHDAIINNDFTLSSTKTAGTKFAPLYVVCVEGKSSATIQLRLSKEELENPFDSSFNATFSKRIAESDAFYAAITKSKNKEHQQIQKQAFAGLLWSKQYYNYDVETWLLGDPKQPKPPEQRWEGRNTNWKTLRNHDIISMPDAWEYPWYASWDLAFHCVTFGLIDPDFGKNQLLLFTKEWYMAPNGQIPAYEWSFSDVNPPVQAWAALQIFKNDRDKTGKGDVNFLKRMFNKLALNFTWWVNRLDTNENNVFEGGFLGLDNIGVFDRSHGIPGKGKLEQVDGTSWMALYCLNMLEMSLEIAMVDETYEDMATKYFGHFVFIAEALNQISKEYVGTWDEVDGFFYDKLVMPDGEYIPIKVRSIASLLAMVALLCIKKETLEQLPKFSKSVDWFKKHRADNLKFPVIQEYAAGGDLLLSLVPKDRMQILAKTVLDENEFLSPYGLRSLSKIHKDPYNISIQGVKYCINYEPAESTSSLFGGNSNWRGPVWMPLNYLFIQALVEYYKYTDLVKVSFPTNATNELDLKQISIELSKRIISVFEKDPDGNRPINQLHAEQYRDSNFEELILFYEYFSGENGRGVGASHQTGWSALVANLINEIQ
ncbi:glucosidase [Flavobacterium sp. TAB 87]|uniref:MGH1-like glycoside hydrolase domain-containing protein n=1 Tax=Flavobacterium sp. TAB 87 TaxID=1729581 RepID=UPI00076C63C1|nr:glucosidase [Flavobacterium sp. TAB 87]KVV15817.1 alpha-glucosidase [Flavobacterium sp. TAB 87]